MLYVFMGPSGSGKTTIVGELCRRYGYKTVESYTTRAPRIEDEQGHIFVSKAEYDALENKVASVCYSGDYYTLTKDQLDECDLVVLEPSAVDDLKRNHIAFKVIYIDVSEKERTVRMKRRKDTSEKIQQRLKEDRKVFEGNIPKDIVFTNQGNLENTVIEIRRYLKNENSIKSSL